MPVVLLNSHWWMYCPFLALPFAQAVCSCQPGMISINDNASGGCHALCKPHSCDKSATCQVTPDGKTRWAQRSRGMGKEQGEQGAQCTVLCSSTRVLAGRAWGGCGMALPLSDWFLWISSCVCKDGEVGDGRACYGHLLHEVQRANQMGLVLLRLRVAIAMLGACPLSLLVTMPTPKIHRAGREEGLTSAQTLVSLPKNWFQHSCPLPTLDIPSGAPHFHADIASLPPTEKGCQEILTTTGPFTVLVPSILPVSLVPSSTMNVSPFSLRAGQGLPVYNALPFEIFSFKH